MAHARTVFCFLEQSEFPAEEFSVDPLWGEVHRTDRPHTLMGDYIDELMPIDSWGAKPPGPDPVE